MRQCELPSRSSRYIFTLLARDRDNEQVSQRKGTERSR
jgi:hypothetical protein